MYLRKPQVSPVVYTAFVAMQSKRAEGIKDVIGTKSNVAPAVNNDYDSETASFGCGGEFSSTFASMAAADTAGRMP